jgi:hypothetical protein
VSYSETFLISGYRFENQKLSNGEAKKSMAFTKESFYVSHGGADSFSYDYYDNTVLMSLVFIKAEKD